MLSVAAKGENNDSVFFERTRAAVSRHMPGLDALRGIAILLVILHNIGSTALPAQAGAVFKAYIFIVDAGWIGVQLFFVLSGFLITGILLDERGAPAQLRNFYWRRVLRIFPIYYATLVTAFVLLPVLGIESQWLNRDREQQLWYWTYLINWVGGEGSFTHFWSLAVEEQFYLLWPLAVVLSNRRNLMRLCFALIVSAPLWRAFIIAVFPDRAEVAAYSYTCARWDALAMGALLAIAVRDPSDCLWLRRYRWHLGALTLAAIAISVFATHDFASVGSASFGINQSLAGLCFALWLFVTVTPDALFARLRSWLDRSPLQFIGKYSYAIYVFHLPVAHFWFTGRATPVYRDDWQMLLEKMYDVGGVFCGSFALALVSWYVLEQPCLRLKRYFTNARTQPAEAA